MSWHRRSNFGGDCSDDDYRTDAQALPQGQMPPRNLVFLVDVSGSMSPDDKLPLLKKAMALLIRHLNETDTVAIVAYAGASGLFLRSTSGGDKRAIVEALDALEPGGSTNGGDGL